MKEPPTILCPRCHGAARVTISRELVDTLTVLGAQRMTSTEVLTQLGEKVGTTAINNRLEDLRAMKLVKRRLRKGSGKTWEYFSIGTK